MFVNAKLVVLATVFSLAVAQDASSSTSSSAPASTGQIPQCVLQCATQALSGSGCSSIADSCVCTNTKFQQASLQCLTQKCSSSDQAAALALQKSLCGGTSASSGASPTSSAGSGSSHSGSGASSTSGSSSSKSNAAGAKVEFGQAGFITLGIAAAGAVVGGLLV